MEYIPTFKKKFREEITPVLREKFGYTSVMQVPQIKKIVINAGVGDAIADKKLIDVAQEELSLIAGQKAIQTISKKSVVGCS